VFYELRGTDTQKKGLLVKFEEHRFAARRGIALLILGTNVTNGNSVSQAQCMEK